VSAYDEDPHPGADGDEYLLRELAAALQAVEGDVDRVAALGLGSYTWRTFDAELLVASLTFDSAVAAEPVTTRSQEGGARVLVFTTEPWSVEVEVLADRLVGQFVPATAGEVRIEGEGGVLATVQADDLGFFVVEPVPRGMVRLRCTTASTPLVTDWVRL
jgi:hypothetical protein